MSQSGDQDMGYPNTGVWQHVGYPNQLLAPLAPAKPIVPVQDEDEAWTQYAGHPYQPLTNVWEPQERTLVSPTPSPPPSPAPAQNVDVQQYTGHPYHLLANVQNVDVHQYAGHPLANVQPEDPQPRILEHQSPSSHAPAQNVDVWQYTGHPYQPLVALANVPSLEAEDEELGSPSPPLAPAQNNEEEWRQYIGYPFQLLTPLANVEVPLESQQYAGYPNRGVWMHTGYPNQPVATPAVQDNENVPDWVSDSGTTEIKEEEVSSLPHSPSPPPDLDFEASHWELESPLLQRRIRRPTNPPPPPSEVPAAARWGGGSGCGAMGGGLSRTESWVEDQRLRARSERHLDSLVNEGRENRISQI